MRKIMRNKKGVSEVISASVALSVIIVVVMVIFASLSQPLEQKVVAEISDLEAKAVQLSSLLIQTSGERDDGGTNWEDEVAVVSSIGLKVNPEEEPKDLPAYMSILANSEDTFTTNNPPETPNSPDPSDESSGVDVHKSLFWSCVDPDGDDLVYDVYFGTGSNPGLVQSNVGEATYDPGVLSYSTHYYWKIVARDEYGSETSGDIWHFITGSSPNHPPNTPSVPSGTTSGSHKISYSYTASTTDPDGDSIRYFFSWGDGTGVWSSFVSSGSSVSVSKSWTSPGAYSVTVKAEDSKGGASAFSAPLVVTLVNSPPATPTTPSGQSSICLSGGGYIPMELCFVEGTRIIMADGSFKSIEKLEPGETIKSYDVENDVFTTDEIKQVFHDSPDMMADDYYLLINGEIGVTSDHLLFIDNKWVPAGELSVGDRLTSGMLVSSIYKVYGRVWTYNLETAGDNHDYLVGVGVDDYIVAHNDPSVIGDDVQFMDDDGTFGATGIYSTSSTDLNGDSIFYRFNWGDGSISGWTSSTSAVHTWSSSGTYSVKAQAKDEFGAESAWSASKSVIVKTCSGGDGDGDNDCCFPAGTMITMADGTYKQIEFVEKGDKVLSYDIDNGVFAEDVVTGTKIVQRLGICEINEGLVSPTDEHPLYVRKSDGRVGWAAVNYERSRNSLSYASRDAMPLEVGDELFTSNGFVEVHSIVYKLGEIETYTFGTANYHTYLANGIVVSNAASQPQNTTPTTCNKAGQECGCVTCTDADGNLKEGTCTYGSSPSCPCNCPSEESLGCTGPAPCPGCSLSGCCAWRTVYMTGPDGGTYEQCQAYWQTTSDGCYCYCPTGEGTCFVAGTKILMADGSLKNIEDIMPGEKIKSYDIENNVFTTDEIKEVFHDSPEETPSDYYLILNNEVGVTPDHLLFIDNKWVPAGKLSVGDRLTSGMLVSSIDTVYDKIWTYNLETVGDNHNFVVNVDEDDYIVAHNGNYIIGGNEEGQTESIRIIPVEYSSVISIYKMYALNQLDPDDIGKYEFGLSDGICYRFIIKTLDGQETLLNYGSTGLSPSEADIVTSHNENIVVYDSYYDAYVYATLETLVYS